MKKNIITIMAIGLLAFFGFGFSCSFTTANISSLAFGKNDKAEPAATTFDVGEKIYAVATVSNTSSKHKMAFKVTYDNVAGKKAGDEAYSQSVDFEGARPIWLAFNVPLPGTYKVEANLMDEEGKKIDGKSGNVTVKGAPMTAPAAGDDKKTDKDEDEDKD